MVRYFKSLNEMPELYQTDTYGVNNKIRCTLKIHQDNCHCRNSIEAC